MTPEPVTLLSLEEALEQLAAPGVLEAFSPVSGAALLAVDFGAAARGAPGRSRAGARAAFARLPCPSLAFAPQGSVAPAAAGWLDAFDVVVGSPAELEAVACGVARAPLAAGVLAQLLRGALRRDVEEGLVAESLAYSTLQAGPEFAAWLAQRGRPARAAKERAAPLRVGREGALLRVTLDRPARRNAFSAALRDALVEALELALADDSLHGVVLDGAGAAFCAGGDLDEFGLLLDPATAHAARTTRSAARLLAALGPRLRAELHGACIGAGIELPAFAARVVARADASFRLPELSMGLVPGAGGTVSLPRRIGRQRTAWLALSGLAIDAATALRWGLVDEVREETD